MNILLTGGTGYVASHVAVSLTKIGHKVILFDNLSNSSIETSERLNKILQRKLSFFRGDIVRTQDLQTVFNKFKIDSVFHFAGLKSVSDSITNPIDYYKVNFLGTINLLNVMKEKKVKNIVFSSSATVYGNPKYLPIDEEHTTYPINPYGKIKLYIEQMLYDISLSDADWRIVCLRYFNPIGSHESGLIGDNPKGPVNNIMPIITKVAQKEISKLSIYGNDYSTTDGTGVRDYIHVMDLAEGHKMSFNFLLKNKGFFIFNLGTGTGYSVLELINSFVKTTNCIVPYHFVSRREGDVSVCYANPKKANDLLKWKAKRNIDEMSLSSWKFSNFYKNKK